MNRYQVDFTEDAATFADRAQPFLSEHPITTTVVATTVARAIRDEELGVARDQQRPWWWATIHDHDSGDGSVVGVAMRTAPSRRPPIWVNEMPHRAATSLAQTLYDRGEFLPGVNGALPAAQQIAEQAARLWSGRAEIGMHSRLFELGAPQPPTGVAGQLRRATDDDAELLHHWRTIFDVEAAQQAGRPPSADPFAVDLETTRRRIAAGNLWVWDHAGEVVHFHGASDPEFGVSRIAPVFTPREHRGHGYAAAAVAAVGQLLLDRGARVCLFTDQANPVSNDLYQRIGFRAVVDMANFTVTGQS